MHHEQAEDFLEGNPGAELFARIQSKTDEPAFSSGQIISGRFRIIDLIGRGGMGVVYRARQELMDRNMAIKMLHSHMVAEPESVKRFYREAKTVSQVRS